MASNPQRIPPLMLVKQLFEETSDYTGKEFFRHLVKNIAQLLQVHGVWVTEFKARENKLNALAFWLNGKFVEHYEYAVKDTPCEPVINNHDICHIPERVIELYPKDPDLPPLGAVSYMGISLRDGDGRVLGHLAMLDNKHMKEIPEVLFFFKLFAVRASSELRRLHYERNLQESKIKIDRLLNGTMDAIVEFKKDLIIVQSNRTASKLLGTDERPLIDLKLDTIVDTDSLKQIHHIMTDMDSHLSYQSHRFPGYLHFKNSAGQLFPADVAIAFYKSENVIFYALAIRDARAHESQQIEIRKLAVETEVLRKEVGLKDSKSILGECKVMKQVFSNIGMVAPTDTTVLITGETGTGKELVAQEIHKNSKRFDAPYITLNCAALPSDLIESELFGYVKGAFTGAVNDREGRFKLAEGGSIFLDEIGEMHLSLQAKLLRVIQEKEFQAIGSSKTQKVDVRIIAATHQDLKKMVSEGKFREDLYYRLHVFPIAVPPLRLRGTDIVLLAETFIKQFSRKLLKPIPELSDFNRIKLLNYSWPGNVRELQNVIERAVIISQPDNLIIDISDSPGNSSERTVSPEGSLLTYQDLNNLEIQNIKRALGLTNGKVFGSDGAADLLGIPPTTLNSKLKKMKIDPKRIQ